MLTFSNVTLVPSFHPGLIFISRIFSSILYFLGCVVLSIFLVIFIRFVKPVIKTHSNHGIATHSEREKYIGLPTAKSAQLPQQYITIS